MERVLEAEVMDDAEEARDYDSMDHRAVNLAFASDLLAQQPRSGGMILDLGTGTARIPIQICKLNPNSRLIAIDRAQEMLALAQRNILLEQLSDRIQIQAADAKKLPFPDRSFAAVISNSIIHHLPDPAKCFAEMKRVCENKGIIFVRDLMRPADRQTLEILVETHAANDNARQKQLFADSLSAALSIEEVSTIVESLGFPSATVQQTSDRHWTWVARIDNSIP